MKQSLILASALFLLSAAPAFGGTGDCSCEGGTGGSGSCDCETDGVPNDRDNCVFAINSGQDDTDGDFCGNACDADYDQNGIVGLSDFGLYSQAFGSTDREFCHVEPIPGCIVGLDDFGVFASLFREAPGPSGTTPGTIACPLP